MSKQTKNQMFVTQNVFLANNQVLLPQKNCSLTFFALCICLMKKRLGNPGLEHLNFDLITFLNISSSTSRGVPASVILCWDKNSLKPKVIPARY
jgi:hypothetical protein